MKTLEDVVLALARHGRARCGAWFGNYPLGVRYALQELLPLVDVTHAGSRTKQTITDAVAAFDQKLAE